MLNCFRVHNYSLDYGNSLRIFHDERWFPYVSLSAEQKSDISVILGGSWCVRPRQAVVQPALKNENDETYMYMNALKSYM